VGFTARHLRGGSWINDHINARAVYRNFNAPGDRNNNIGFRVVVVRPTPLGPLQRPCRVAWQSEPFPFIREQRLPELLVEYALPAEAKS
jgi:hypothetical protein